MHIVPVLKSDALGVAQNVEWRNDVLRHIVKIKFASTKLQLASFCNYGILCILILNIGEFRDVMFDIFKKMYMIKFEEINCSAYRSNEIVSFLATY